MRKPLHSLRGALAIGALIAAISIIGAITLGVIDGHPPEVQRP